MSLFTAIAAIITILSQLGTVSAVDDDNCTTYGDVRLVGGSGPYEGNVQVCMNGTWGYVCDGDWDEYNARVVCYQLGYSSSSSYAYSRTNSYFGHDTSGNVSLDNVDCYSYNTSYSKLTDCPHGSITCSPAGANIAGVSCAVGGTCTNGAVRLISLYTIGRSQGRVEVCHNQQWGTICRDNWTEKNTQVICGQLGYSGDYGDTIYNSYGSTSNPIVYNDVNCVGDETTITSCSKSMDTTGCSHSNDIAVRCYSLDESSCSHGDFRLWSAYDTTPTNEGILQTCSNGRWTAMCDSYSSYSCYIGRIACRSMGYEGAYSMISNAGVYYGYYYDNDNYRYICYSYCSSLSQCDKLYYYNHGCGSYTDALGLVCANSTEVTINQECSTGDVRLVNGWKENMGRVEYCYNGQWSPMCSLSVTTARLVCKALGYQYPIVTNRPTFGRSDTHSSFDHLNCSLYNTDLSQCSVIRKGCLLSESGSTCYREYGLTCLEPTETCQGNDVRLVGGQIEQEGTVEVCYNGIWGTVCRDNWHSIDTYIVCKTLGYDGPYPTSHTSSFNSFGQGSGFPVWNYLKCYGWEKTIYECEKSVYPDRYCFAVGVTCKENCQNGDVRLSGREYSNEGTVEVCYNNLWGLIVASDWSEDNAAVVCHQLGYSRTGAVSVTDSRYGKSEHGIVIVGAVTCSGSEDIFDDCDIQLIPVDDGRELVKYVNVSGVVCAPGPSPTIGGQSGGKTGNTGMSVAVGVMAFLLVMAIAALIGVILLEYIKHKMKQSHSLSASGSHQICNPMNDVKENPNLYETADTAVDK